MDMLIGQGPKPATEAALIVDGDGKSFMRDVMDASRDVPVLVDFWATWCGPCKQLTPILEKVVRQAGGRVRLVKIDIDKNRALVQQLAALGLPMQSVPTVAAFWRGQIVDVAQGAMAESEVKRLVEDIVKMAGGTLPGADLLAQAKAALEAGDPGDAFGLFSALLQAEPENPEAWAGLARASLAAGQEDQAEATLLRAPANLSAHPAIAGALAAIGVAREGKAASAMLGGLRERVAADPGDHQARLELANAWNADGDRAAAADALLEIIRADPAWNEGAAKAQLLKFFEAWGLEDPASIAGRRKLSALLFR